MRREKQFNHYFDFDTFALGVSFGITNGITGWRYMLSLDVAFLSVWVYFKRV
jgi:hypothetical protein